MAGFEEGLDCRVTSRPAAGAMQVDERGKSAGRPYGNDLDSVLVSDRHSAVAGAEIDAITERRSHQGTIKVEANG
jgi:hypothetical protein